MLRWFGHKERMDEDQLVKRKVGPDVRGVRLRGRRRTGWIDGAKRELNERRMSVEQRIIIVHDRSKWRAVVNV